MCSSIKFTKRGFLLMENRDIERAVHNLTQTIRELEQQRDALAALLPKTTARKQPARMPSLAEIKRGKRC